MEKKTVRELYKRNLRLAVSMLITLCSSISLANGAILTVQFDASGGHLGDGSFHSHREDTFAADGSFLSSNSTGDLTGSIDGQFKFNTAAMPPDGLPSLGFHEYKTSGGPSWSTSDLIASPASGLSTPSFVYSSGGTIATDFQFVVSGFGGGLLRVTDTAFSSPGPF